MSGEVGRETAGEARDGAVRYQRRGAVATILFDRPAARNALTWTMYDQLDEALERLDGEAGVRVCVLRGAGGAFVAGTDISRFAEFASAEDGVRYERRLEETFSRLEAVPVPTVAVVEGPAVGAGLVLAAACDLRVCTPDARFGAPIARTVGNCLSLANHARLLAHLGPGRTKALLFLAELLGAEEARAAGFVLDVVPAAELDARVEQLCERIVEHAPLTLRVTKEAIRRLLSGDAAAGADDLVRLVYGSGDFRRGVEGFLTKSRPRWEGS